MSVSPPGSWLLNRIVYLINKTLELINTTVSMSIQDLLNNANTFKGINAFTQGIDVNNINSINGNTRFNSNIVVDGDILANNANFIGDKLFIKDISLKNSAQSYIIVSNDISVNGNLIINGGTNLFGDLTAESKITSRGGFVLYSRPPAINYTGFSSITNIVTLPNPNKIITLSTGSLNNNAQEAAQQAAMTLAVVRINSNNLNINQWEKYYIIGDGDHLTKVELQLLLTSNTNELFIDNNQVVQLIVYYNLKPIYNGMPTLPTSPEIPWEFPIATTATIFREISIFSYLMEDEGEGEEAYEDRIDPVKTLFVHIHTFS